MTAVGFTGTRRGMSDMQLSRLLVLLAEEQAAGAQWLHHGQCVGADEQANQVALSVGLLTHAHPASDVAPEAVAQLTATEYSLPLPALQRNRVIVSVSAQVIAAPHQTYELMRGSGTWATIRYARAAQKRLRIVWPNGTVLE